MNQSKRVFKFFWSTLQLEPEGVTTSYFSQTQDSITNRAGALALHECLAWPAPYLRSVIKLKVLLKCICSYLSRGNIETHLDGWITAVDGEDAGNKADVRDYLRGLTVPLKIQLQLASTLLITCCQELNIWKPRSTWHTLYQKNRMLIIVTMWRLTYYKIR